MAHWSFCHRLQATADTDHQVNRVCVQVSHLSVLPSSLHLRTNWRLKQEVRRSTWEPIESLTCRKSSRGPTGVPVHLKKGLIDKLLFRTTMGLTVGGALYCLVALYFAAQPSNK